jgi:hypothetical protein
MRRIVFLAALAICACGRDESLIDCDDLLPAEETSYRELALIITSEADPRNCAQCHQGDAPTYGLNLETPQSAYFTLRDRIDRVYANVATGEMPKDGLAWGDAELRLLRSWYCRGAFYD